MIESITKKTKPISLKKYLGIYFASTFISALFFFFIMIVYPVIHTLVVMAKIYL